MLEICRDKLEYKRRFSSLIYSADTTYSFDIDLPTECDDEYWINDNPDLAFKQPPGKPSTVAMFNCILRLGRILAQAYRTIVRSIAWSTNIAFNRTVLVLHAAA